MLMYLNKNQDMFNSWAHKESNFMYVSRLKHACKSVQCSDFGILRPVNDRFRSFYCISPRFKADIYSTLKEKMLMDIHKTKGNKKSEIRRRRAVELRSNIPCNIRDLLRPTSLIQPFPTIGIVKVKVSFFYQKKIHVFLKLFIRHWFQ